MQQVKVRAWNIAEQRMFIPMLGSFNEHGQLYSVMDQDRKIYKIENGEVSVMLSTGHKDKRNKEAWENDLFRPNSAPKGKCLQVSWMEGFWDPFANPIDEDQEFSHLGEIIGNIYENPELGEGLL